MKNKHLNVFAAILITVFISNFFSSCGTLVEIPFPPVSPAVENPGKEQPPTHIPISIHFLNATTNPRSVQPTNVTVEIYDVQGNIVSSVNTPIPKAEQFQLNENVLNLQLPISSLSSESGDELSYAFTINAKAKDFASVTKTIVINGLHGIYVPTYMVHKPEITLTPNRAQIKKLADGLIENRININTETLQGQQFTINNKAPNAVSQNTTVTFASGTQLQDINSIPIEGNLALTTLYTGDTRFDIPLRTFPNNFLVTNAIDGKTNEQIATLSNNPFFFRVFSYFDLNITLNNQEVKKLSKPAEVSIRLNAVENKIFDFKDGDAIEIWALNKKTGQWKLNNITQIKDINNGLEAVFNIVDITAIALAKKVAACPTPVQMSIDNGTAPYRVRFFELKYGSSSGSTGTIPAPNFLILEQGTPYEFDFIAPIDSIYLDIKESTNPTHATLMERGFTMKDGCKASLGTVLVPQQTGEKCEEVEFLLKRNQTQIGAICALRSDIEIGIYTKIYGSTLNTMAGYLGNGLINMDMSGITSGQSMELRIDYDTLFISLDLNVESFTTGARRFSPTGNSGVVVPRLPNAPVGIQGTGTANPFGSTCNNKTIIDFRIAESLYSKICSNSN